MKQVLIRQGQVLVEDVPAPQVEPGTLLVQVSHSCISAGTEISGVKNSASPLIVRAMKNPKAVVKTLRMAATQGIAKTHSIVTGALLSGGPTGYSAAGTVLQVGEGLSDFWPGDRVACAGAQCAHHAEMIRVPHNLAVPIPSSLDFDQACTVTLGSIALQGVRRAQPTLGESFAVIGLGILGQLTAQLLKANGVRVIGTDLLESRIGLARDLGMESGISPEEENPIDQVFRLTGGIGADGVIITAATASDAIVSSAFQMCRKKGRVVLVGDVGLNLNRADFYAKELDFFISTSYGPGRYDSNYEEKGLDYPVGYVRWTENRNMAEYLRLLAEEALNLSGLISKTYPIEQAGDAFESLKEKENEDRPFMVLLNYPPVKEGAAPMRKLVHPTAKKIKPGTLRVGIAGAGGFAKGMHLPNLKALSKLYHIQAIMSRTGHNAKAVAKQFEADYSTTDYQVLLDDPEVDCVIICSRHNLHADMALKALRAGKHVLVEKPLALSWNELEEIKNFFNELSEPDATPVLLTGFNRRFSPFATKIRDAAQKRSNPMILNYRMNAGHIPADHWVHAEEGGGRNLGEACHIYDLFTFFTGAKVTSVHAQTIAPSTEHFFRNDNFIATLNFDDGSLASLTYTALGNREFPKERLDLYVDGKVFVIDDYKRYESFGLKGKNIENSLAEKGHREELEALARTINVGGEWPIPLWQQIQASEIALRIDDLLKDQQPSNLT